GRVPFAGGLSLHPAPLPIQQELSEAESLNPVRQIAPRPGQGCRLALNELCGPIEIACAAVAGFQGAEQCVIVQPMCLFMAKLFKRRSQFRIASNAEIAPGDL